MFVFINFNFVIREKERCWEVFVGVCNSRKIEFGCGIIVVGEMWDFFKGRVDIFCCNCRDFDIFDIEFVDVFVVIE